MGKRDFQLEWFLNLRVKGTMAATRIKALF